jgi:hypothetical protein
VIIQRLVGPFEREVPGHNNYNMLRAIGFLIILWGLSIYFDGSFEALDEAGQASFEAIEAAANKSKENLYSL